MLTNFVFCYNSKNYTVFGAPVSKVKSEFAFKIFMLFLSHLTSPAAVAWFVKAPVYHSVNSAPSANGESNPA